MPPPIKLGTITIASGQTESPEVDMTKAEFAWVRDLILRSPVTLPETVSVEVSDVSGGTFIVLQSGGTDITLPANKATQVGPVAFPFMKLLAAPLVAASRAFTLTGREDDK